MLRVLGQELVAPQRDQANSLATVIRVNPIQPVKSPSENGKFRLIAMQPHRPESRSDGYGLLRLLQSQPQVDSQRSAQRTNMCNTGGVGSSTPSIAQLAQATAHKKTTPTAAQPVSQASSNTASNSAHNTAADRGGIDIIA
jgi:hypothetical protein